MKAQPFDLSPGRHNWPEHGQPIVFLDKPSHYEVVADDAGRLRAWQVKMAELVGFEPERAAAGAGLETVSFCGFDEAGNPIDCDCDWI